jgi:AraC-like DNA-binding protein
MVNKNIIDTTLEQAREWGNALYLNDGLVLTDQIAHASISKEPQRLNFIMMALCRKGQATFSIDTREQTVRPGDLFFISERHIIDNYQASDDFQCLCIMLSTQFYHGFVQNVKNVSSLLLFSMNNPVVHLTPQELQNYGNYFDTIRRKMADEPHHYRTELVQALLLAMFYDMSGVIYRIEQSSAKKQSRSDVIFARFINLLQENFRQERRVSWYAKQLEITAKYLSEVVKSVSKRTPNEWIDSYVVLEIRVLLKNSPKSIKEITDELNFPNQSFLGKYFKEHVGVSPSEYRKG